MHLTTSVPPSPDEKRIHNREFEPAVIAVDHLPSRDRRAMLTIDDSSIEHYIVSPSVVFFRESLSYLSSWHAGMTFIGGNILCNNGAGSNNSSPSYPDARDDNGSIAYPSVVFYYCLLDARAARKDNWHTWCRYQMIVAY
jgi:hypothetical protein